MEHPLIHDRGRGPELIGTRITIYDLVPYFLKPVWTEAAIAEANRVTTEQVAAMRAYFLEHYADVMAEQERIEEQIRKGMEDQQTPEFQSRFWWNRERLDLFRDWMAERSQSKNGDRNGSQLAPTDLQTLQAEFRDWYETREPIGAAG